MKRAGHLYSDICELDNLHLAFCKAVRGKTMKMEVKEFQSDYDQNIRKLRLALLSHKVIVGKYHYFRISDPKERKICAASFDERVMHHAIMNVCHPYFERNLIEQTHASRTGKGIYTAINSSMKACTKYQYVAKLDFRHFYDSISHDVLKEKLLRLFKDRELLSLLFSIIDSYEVSCGLGLPIGNLTSQYFANYYLSAFDHYSLECLHTPVYIRYMDDIFLASNDREKLVNQIRAMDGYAQSNLRLRLKPPVIHRSADGAIFLGYRIMPHHVLLSGRSKRRYRTKLMNYTKMLINGTMHEDEYADHLIPLIAFAQHACSKKFRASCERICKGGCRAPTA